MHLPNVTEGPPIRAKCFPDSALWFQDYHIWLLLQPCWWGGEGVAAEFLEQQEENSKETLEPTPANKQSLVAGMVLEAWHWTLLLDSFQEFPKNFNGGCTYTLWSWLALKAAHPLASRWLRKAMSCQISKGQPQTSWKMHSLLPEGALCSGISAVGALQDSFKERSGSRTTPMLACLLGLKLWNFLKVLSWKPFSPAIIHPMINSQLTLCKHRVQKSLHPALLLGASCLHSSWASCRAHSSKWPSRRSCPQSIHCRVSAQPAITRKKSIAALRTNIVLQEKTCFLQVSPIHCVQYMLSNTSFFQHINYHCIIFPSNFPMPISFPMQQATVLQRPSISVCTSCSRVPAVLVCAAWSAVCVQLLVLHA